MASRPQCEQRGCPLPPSAGKAHCPLHDTDPGKDAAGFQRLLEQRLGQMETDQTIEEIDLSSVHFPARVDWSGREFSKPVSLRGAQFHQQAYFSGAQFHQVASFWDAQFHQGAYFGDAQFHKEADFLSAQFHQGAYFGDAQFHRGAFFVGAQFHQGASFQEAQFHQEADFRDAQFHQEVAFGGAQFSPAARTDFSASTVGGRLRFRGKGFPSSGAALAPGQGLGRVLFQDMVIAERGEMLFEGVDLSRASFLRTDLSQVRFRDVRWASREERAWLIPFIRRKYQVLFDHREMERAGKGGGQGLEEVPAPHLVGELCRQLRLNFESSRQEIEAGDFYIGQMDMRRRDVDHFSGSYRGVFLPLYRFIALYGESWQRPLVLYLILGLAFAWGYLLAGFEGVGSPVHYELRFSAEALGGYFKDYFFQALPQALTAGGLGQQAVRFLSGWAPLLRYFNILGDIILLGLAAVALRRRFRR